MMAASCSLLRRFCWALDIEITDEAAGIARGGDLELAARGIDSVRLRLARGVEHLQAGEVVLHLAERVEDRTAIRGDGSVVARLRELHLRTAGAAGKNILRKIGAHGPKSAGGIEQLGNLLGVPATLAIKYE